MPRSYWWWLALALGVVTIDQLNKATYSDYTLNTLGGFSLGIQNVTAAILAGLLLCTLAVVAINNHKKWVPNQLVIIGLVLELGGGYSNLLDRWYFGGVRDVYVLPLTSFNLADISIAGGALLVISSLIFTQKNRASIVKTDYYTTNETTGT